MKTIETSRGQKIFVDDHDYEELSQYTWHVGSHGYAARSVHGPKRATVLMHRQIMGLSAGYRTQVDHIDGNTLNNCRSNLRLCTQKENKQNIRLKSNSRSRIKGVYYDAARDRWQAYICVDKKKIHLGRHKTPEDAHMAYAAAARAYFGDFANLG
ncbi:AP2 domain-containing protein [Cupriavidus gilardii]|jgi:hypothetical protein|uniref:AP2 domain-containing protein n=2 Tax=Cupriavidus gilardii TaxID=82541 RepID=UPI00158010AA|nr:HNH endonuclease [Cupriavidus gilardii]